jgi:hypothetical protein
MAITFPLSLPNLNDKLRVSSVTWDAVRFDEHSGIGSGHDLQSEMAKPKWTAEITLAAGKMADVKQIAAVIRALHGSQNSFMLADPSSLYPQSDPTGAVLGASAVRVHTVGSNGKSLRLQGLPASYVLTVGDKGQISFGSNPGRNYFFEVSETVTASGGITPLFDVFPHLPVGIATNQAVILAKPACKMILLPGSLSAGTTDADRITRGTSFKAIERK